MIPLIPTLVFSIVSFAFSAFVILRTLAPLIPESRIHPKRRIHTKGYGLSQPENSHIWLAAIDILSVIVFVWEVFEESLTQRDRQANAIPSAVRLHFVVTFRLTCLLVIMFTTLLQIRQARASSFGPVHLFFLLPALFLAGVSCVVSGIIASVGAKSILYVTGTYMCLGVVLITVVMAFLMYTLRAIRRNLAALGGMSGSWQGVVGEGKVFPHEYVEALKEGSSWITSDSGSGGESLSSFSFESTNEAKEDIPEAVVEQSRSASCSQHENSWLTEPSVLPPTMADWSFPTSREVNQGSQNALTSSPIQWHEQYLPIIRRAQSHLPDCDVEKAFNLLSRELPKSVNVSWRSVAGWMVFVWIPSILAAPFVFSSSSSEPVSVLLILSVTISAPLLTFNSVFSPLPIPTDLFGDQSGLPKPSKPAGSHRRSASATLVEGRRSGDVWLSKGDAIDGKDRISRAASYLSRVPKLSVLPVKLATDDLPAKQEATHHSPQYDSAATSAFVAINAYCSNELGWLPGLEDGDVSSGARSCHYRRVSVPKSHSTFSRCAGPSSSASRRSSASSRVSSISRLYRNNFTSNLETIIDVSMNSPVRYMNSVYRPGENMYAFPRTEHAGSPAGRLSPDLFSINSSIPQSAHARETSIVYERGESANDEYSIADNHASISGLSGIRFPSRLVRTASDRTNSVSRRGPQ